MTPGITGLLRCAEIAFINTEALDRWASRHGVTAHDVLAWCAPTELAAARRSDHQAADYWLRSPDEIERIAARAPKDVAHVLRAIAATCLNTGVRTLALPAVSTGGIGKRTIPHAPAFVQAAIRVRTIEPGGLPKPLEFDELQATLPAYRESMRPHVDGVSLTLAKLAGALEVGPLSKALAWEENAIGSHATKVALAAISIALAFQVRDRAGALGLLGVLGPAAGLLLEVLSTGGARDESKAVLELLLDVQGLEKAPALWHEVTCIVSSSESVFRCPDNASIDRLAAAAMQAAIAERRNAQERESLGLSVRSALRESACPRHREEQ